MIFRSVAIALISLAAVACGSSSPSSSVLTEVHKGGGMGDTCLQPVTSIYMEGATLTIEGVTKGLDCPFLLVGDAGRLHSFPENLRTKIRGVNPNCLQFAQTALQNHGLRLKVGMAFAFEFNDSAQTLSLERLKNTDTTCGLKNP